jgi:glutamine---fructose-6-phosphate transaminase (isomerizing)
LNADMSWHTEDYPELRSGPPWVMQEMIAAEPALAGEMLARPSAIAASIAKDIDAALRGGRVVTVTGCGTSEHAARGVAALIAAAVAREHRALVRARPALTAALEPSDGVCFAVSHDGGTRATALAVAAARGAGARTSVITHDASGSVAASADHVLVTPRHDDSWCHTVAYVSALLAGASIASSLGATSVDAAAARDVLTAAIELDARPVAQRLADRRVVLCAGAGIDHISARELALKIAEGARLPTVALELETVLHGQLAGHEPADALVVVALADGPEEARVARRLGHVVRAAAAIGIPVAALLSRPFDETLAPQLTPGGRLVVDLPAAGVLGPDLAALLAGAGLLQTLTLQLAHARNVNPDLIRREEAAYRQAAQAGEATSDW